MSFELFKNNQFLTLPFSRGCCFVTSLFLHYVETVLVGVIWNFLQVEITAQKSYVACDFTMSQNEDVTKRFKL